MNEDELRTLLPAERSLPAVRRHDMRERLTGRIEDEDRSSRRGYRLAMVAAAAAVVGVVGTAAVLAGTGGDGGGDDAVTTPMERPLPDAGEAARAEEHVGFRPMLQAEIIDCTGRGSTPPATVEGDGGDTTGRLWARIALTEPVTRSVLVEECASNYFYEVGGAQPPDPLVAEVCVRDHPGGFVTALVAFDGVACDAAGGRPMADADLAALDHQRAIEVALLADDRDCPTVGDTVGLVEDVLAEARIDLDIEIDNAPLEEPGVDGEPVSHPAPPCPRFARVDWKAGTVWVEPFRA